MAKFTARCPGCHGKFPWDPTLGYPKACALGCGYTTEIDETVIPMPFLRSPNTNKTDGVYRQLERDSEHRAEMAANMAGVPVSEMSHLKVTNIKDNTQVGEVAAMPVVNDVTRQMEFMRQRGGQVGFQSNVAQTYGDAAISGAVNLNGKIIGRTEPRAGVKAMDLIQSRFNR